MKIIQIRSLFPMDWAFSFDYFLRIHITYLLLTMLTRFYFDPEQISLRCYFCSSVPVPKSVHSVALVKWWASFRLAFPSILPDMDTNFLPSTDLLIDFFCFFFCSGLFPIVHNCYPLSGFTPTPACSFLIFVSPTSLVHSSVFWLALVHDRTIG